MTESARVFGDIYRNRIWGSGSGGGSTPELIPEYIALVESVIEGRRPKAVLDIGCGDGVLASAINWGAARYIGIDVVPAAVMKAANRMPSSYVHCCDALTEDLPDADLVLLKEVTQHLDIESILKLVNKLERYSAVLHTSMVYGEVNGAIDMGQTRGIDLTVLNPWIGNVETVLSYRIGESQYISQLWRPRG